MTNRTATKQVLPHFNTVDATTILTELKRRLAHYKTSVDKLLANPPAHWTWDTLIQPLDHLANELNKWWSPISHLQAVKNNETLRAAYNEGLALLSEHHNTLAHNHQLYQAVQNLSSGPYYDQLERAQQTILQHTLRDFKLSGITLAADKQQQFKELDQKLSQLQNTFDNNVLDATNAWTLHITDKTQLKGLTPHALQMMQTAARQQQLPGWLITLHFPSYYAVMTYADDRTLRKTLYEAYCTRASDQGPHANRFDNSHIMQDILNTRQELAQLVGFDNYAAYSLASKMASDADKVLTFLNDLVQQAKPQALAEYQQLQNYAQKNIGIDDLQPWDLSYVSEKWRQTCFDINEAMIRAYFPIDTVMQGLFDISKRLYGMNISRVNDFPSWHEDVQCYVIHDEAGELRGYCYFDLYARQDKRGGAWMDEYCSRYLMPEQQLQYPIAYVNCNFAKGEPSLLNHEEVTTLFHEFGHALHHLLTRIHYLNAAGINGVPWDAVEFPSQFYEHWCWHYSALTLLTQHYQTKQTLPAELFDKMLAAKNFQSAMQLMRQLEFSLFDFKLHLNSDVKAPHTIQQILDDVRQSVTVTPIAAFNRFQHSFSHIFAGGYAAGYYSYLWADVLASDAFATFEQQGIFDANTGRQFLHCILEQGGSDDPLTLFKAFCGHEPTIDALLRHRGIQTNAATNVLTDTSSYSDR